MPGLGRQPFRAQQHPAVHDDAAADPRADGQIDHVPDAAASAVEILGQAGDVGVVAEECGSGKPLADQRAQRDIAPAGQVGRFQHHAGDRVERSGRADPDAGHIGHWRVADRFRDRGVDPADHRFRPILRLGQPGNAAEDLAIDAAQRGANLGPAQVNGND